MFHPLEILLQEARKSVEEIFPEELKEKLDARESLLLVDVREPHERAQGILPGAMPLPFGEVEASIAQTVPDTNADIVLYCHMGVRSLLAAHALQRMGYRNARSLAGGIHAWSGRGLPVERP